MNCLETCACSTYMPIKISYKKLLTTRYISNQAISLSTLVEAYLGGIRTNYVQDHITDDQSNYDKPLTKEVDHTYNKPLTTTNS